jgi:hypothetical protein
VWDWEANVVKVTLASSSVLYANSAEQHFLDQTLIVSYFDIVKPGAMEAFANIERIEGPTRGGVRRGAKFIEMGFIQNTTTTTNHADFNYDPFDNDDDVRRQFEGVNGQWYLDTFGGSTLPWYDSAGASIPGGGQGFFSPPNDAVLTGTAIPTFHIADRPQVFGTDVWIHFGDTSDDKVDLFAIVIDFHLFFAVRTTDVRLQANDRFTQLAKSFWRFDGSGVITSDAAGTDFVWNNTAPFVMNEQINNSGGNQLAVVTSGILVPETSAPIANDIYNAMGWEYVPAN